MAAEEPAGPKPIPASQVLIRAEEMSRAVREMSGRPASNPELDEISGELPEFLVETGELLRSTETTLRRATSLREFEVLERRWQRATTKIEDWRQKVRTQMRALERSVQSLQEMREEWTLTLEAVAGTGSLVSLVDDIEGAIARIDAAEQTLGTARSNLSVVASQLVELEEMTTDAAVRMRDAEANVASLKKVDGRPLWMSFSETDSFGEMRAEIADVWREGRLDLLAFYRQYEGTLKAQLFAFVLLVLALAVLWFRVRGANDEDNPASRAAFRVASRPVEVAVIVNMLFVVFGYPGVPRFVDSLAIFCLFPVILRVTPEVVLSRHRLSITALVLLVVLDRLIAAMPYLSLAQRTGMLVVPILGIGLALHGFFQEKKALDAGERSRERGRFARIAAQLAIGSFLVSLVANFVGHVALALVTCDTPIMSAYLGIVLAVFYFVVDSILFVGLQTRSSRRLRIVSRHGPLLRRRIGSGLKVVLIAFWAVQTLASFRLWNELRSAAETFLSAELHFGEIGISLGSVLALALTIFASFMISRLLRFILEEEVYHRFPMPRGLPHATSTLAHYSILLIGFFLAVAATGIELSKFTILAGAFGVGIGFGMQTIINNFVSGLILLMERPIMPGDTIALGDLIGEVKRIGLRASTVRTWQGAEVIVPNGHLISEKVINWTLSDEYRRLDTPVGVAYGTDPERVIALLMEVAANEEGILGVPKPVALFLGFGESSLDFELRAWSPGGPNWLEVKSRLTISVNRALVDAGITIPFPQRDVHIKGESDSSSEP